jgi:hypothetical protein
MADAGRRASAAKPWQQPDFSPNRHKTREKGTSRRAIFRLNFWALGLILQKLRSPIRWPANSALAGSAASSRDPTAGPPPSTIETLTAHPPHHAVFLASICFFSARKSSLSKNNGKCRTLFGAVERLIDI